jgi:hypothetical protein
VSVCVVADFGATRYQPDKVLMQAENLDFRHLTRHYV